MQGLSLRFLIFDSLYGFLFWEYTGVLLAIYIYLRRNIGKWDEARLENFPFRFVILARKRDLAAERGVREGLEQIWPILRFLLFPSLFFLPTVFLIPIVSLIFKDPSFTSSASSFAHLIMTLVFPGLLVPLLLIEIYRVISDRLRDLDLKAKGGSSRK